MVRYLFSGLIALIPWVCIAHDCKVLLCFVDVLMASFAGVFYDQEPENNKVFTTGVLLSFLTQAIYAIAL